VVLTDIYPAGEDPIPGVTLDALAAAVQREVRGQVDIVPRLADLAEHVADIARPGDLVITLGAGSIGTLADQLIARLSSGTAA
jgi:UDP-N-acetylmuramate--alanine ligase